MKTNNIDFSDALARNGLKITKNRTAILRILAQSDQPLAAEEIFWQLKNKKISVNLSTVYRTLEILTDKNLLTKINIEGDNRALFEFNPMVHRHYLVCLGCKKILTINYCPLKDYEKSLAKETNYTIAGHKLDIYGYCPDCMAKSRPEV